MNFFSRTDKTVMVAAADALPGRSEAIVGNEIHTVLGTPIMGPYPDGFEKILVGMGCFWGAERKFWQTEGVWTTAAGYTAGFTPNPTYQETCTNNTGHTEVVLAVFDPSVTSYEALLQVFWENHDPTHGMRQGNDIGTTYRSGIYTYGDAQQALALKSRDAFAGQLAAGGYGAITTEIIPATELYFAEDYHQQYLDKNPNGYCGMGGTGVSCPIGLFADEAAR